MLLIKKTDIENDFNIKIVSLRRIVKKDILNDVYELNSDKKLFLKEYLKVQSTNETWLTKTLVAQDYVSKYGLAPKIYRNNEFSILSFSNNIPYTIQEFLNYSETKCEDSLLFSTKLAELHRVLKESNIDFDFNVSNKNWEFIYGETCDFKKIIDNESKLINDNSNLSKVYLALKQLLNLKEKLLLEFHDDYNPRYIGAIHGDLRPTNCMIHNGNLKFIDFDYCCIGDLAYEIGNSFALFSNYDYNKFLTLLENYNLVNNSDYSSNEILKGLMMSILQSSFPYKHRKNMKSNTLLKITLEKIRMLEFSYNNLYEEGRINGKSL